MTLTKAVGVCHAWEATTIQVDLFKNTQGQILSENAVFCRKNAVRNTSGQGTSGQSTFGRVNQARNTFRKTQVRQIKWKYQTTSVNGVVLSPMTRGFILHVKQHPIIAMPWDIINQSAAKGPKKYIMYRTVHLHQVMYQSSLILLISLDILQKTWVEFLPRPHRRMSL